ncbi:MAG: hypothetical protein JNN12_15925 [Bacteroidetes Order II. Incertae sedis bacterium]|nr:hypothetical protein [Bacteroidetes Order II. bacterium]
MLPALEKTDALLTASRLRLRLKSPFFATLALFAEYRIDDSLETAGTDGKDILINPTYAASLTNEALDGLLLHEVLHAALRHTIRLGERDGYLWNIAADVVVNGIIARHGGFTLPEGAIRMEKWEAFSVEEVYDLLMKRTKKTTLPMPDLRYHRAIEMGGQGADELEVHWQHALEQANAVVIMGRGNNGLGIHREFRKFAAPPLDWRTHLSRFLIRTPHDFEGFDRRFVGKGLYLDSLDGQGLRIFVVIDTSGSVTNGDLGRFLAEVQGILGTYPHIVADLYYLDATLYGPVFLEDFTTVPPPVGAGGTSFVPFFDHIARLDEAQQQNAVVVFLTDGEGLFPEIPPLLPVLWVVTTGGRPSERFPFGEVLRMTG